MPEHERAENPHWRQAILAQRILLNAGPCLGGIRVRARAGPVRDAWIDRLRDARAPDAPWLRIGPSPPAVNLLGGIDLERSLEAGQLLDMPGLLARANGGYLVLAMAERMAPSVAALIAGAMDSGSVRSQSGRTSPARFTVIALDEGADEEERIPTILADRLALTVDLQPISIRDTLSDLPHKPQQPTPRELPPLPDELTNALCELSGRLDNGSMRLALWLTAVTRHCALEDDAPVADASHAALALRLCTGLQATEPHEEQVAQQDTAASDGDETEDRAQNEPHDEKRGTEEEDAPAQCAPEELTDLIVAAAAVNPDELLALPDVGRLQARGNAAGGRGGASLARSKRGRPCGLVASAPTKDARPNAVATLRAAAPWQMMRRRVGIAENRKLIVLPGDFRYTRYRDAPESTAIFAVDASGSTALDRLGEAKGAIELLLGDCYVRRHHVAMISFRGKTAEILLEPTRSLVRAKRSLTALPGGGGTPLAGAISCTIELATQIRRRGSAPLLVYLTDGRANIALDGSADRNRARDDARKLALKGAALGFRSLFIDVARRPREDTRDLANAMAAEYCVLPNANASAVSDVVGRRLQAD